jgi:quinol monooxygenase YgiN
VYWFFELYTDAAGVAAHGKGDAMSKAMAATGAFLAAPPEIHRLTPVVAKGLDI